MIEVSVVTRKLFICDLFGAVIYTIRSLHKKMMKASNLCQERIGRELKKKRTFPRNHHTMNTETSIFGTHLFPGSIFCPGRVQSGFSPSISYIAPAVPSF